MNGPPKDSPEAEKLISSIVEQYCEQKHNKVPQIYIQMKISKMICTQIGEIDIHGNNEYIKKIFKKRRTGQWVMAAYFDLDFGGAYSSSKEEYNHDDEM